AQVLDGQPGFAELAAEAWSLHSRLHANSQETEFGVAQSRARASDQRYRGDYVHSRCRAQFAGTLDRSDTRGAREGSAGRSLSRDSWHAGFGRCQRSQEEPIEVRRQASEGRSEVRLRNADFGLRIFKIVRGQIRNPKFAIRNRGSYAETKSRRETRSSARPCLQQCAGD